MGGNIVNVRSSPPPGSAGCVRVVVVEAGSMGLACCWVLKGQAALTHCVGVLVSSAPGAGLAFIPVPVLPFSLLREGVGVLECLVGGVMGLWVGGCL